MHLVHRPERAEADIEVSAAKDREEWQAGEAGTIALVNQAGLIPQADPCAAEHVAAEGDFDDRQGKTFEREDAISAKLGAAMSRRAVLLGAYKFARLLPERTPDRLEHGLGVIERNPDAQAH